MRYSILIVAFLMFNLTGYSQTTSGQEDRIYWVNILSQIADPLLNSMSKGELKKNIPVETISGVPNPSNARTTHLEALGRLFVGMAPWLELGPDNTQEGQIREKYICLMIESINHGFNPQSPDYLNFTVTRQPLVDTAFFCQGLLRSPKQIWSKLSAETQKNILNALQQVSKIKPVESNWLLFSAMIEATLLELTGKCNMHPIEYAIMRFKEWYKGDSWYGDGINLHMDYYNSFVIHPMLLDILEIMQKHNKGETDLYKKEQLRFSRYAEQQERLISPEGTFPIVGRSLAYRFGAFHALSDVAYRKLLPERVKPAQVRSALSAIINRQVNAPGTFNPEGWLRVGFAGYQPHIGETYISTGSLYLCAAVFIALGLPESDEFWSSPSADWTCKKGWAGIDLDVDKALKK